MRTLSSKRNALGICAVAAILAGCGAAQIGAPGTVQPLGYQTQHLGNIDAKGTIKILHSFAGSPDGAEPWSGIAFNRDNPNVPSDLGTTLMGGDANNDGTVYGLTPGKKGSWTESLLYTFKGVNYSDGSEPVAIYKELDIASPRFFVTTVAGGTYGDGAVVGLTPTSSGVWTEAVLHSFGFPPDGANPYGTVITDKTGNLYGTTSAGGSYGAGTVYRLQPAGSSYSETVLYSFKGGTDGDHPYSALIIDKKGALYGTTVDGGSAGYGSVFKLTPSGSGYTESILYSFQGAPSDGAYPYGSLTPVGGGLALVAGGKVIGMTSSAGSHGGGVAYELTGTGSSYKESVLWNFGVSGDGTTPYGSVVVDKKGVIYGTTYGGGSGGSSGLGTFFTLTPSGSTFKESVYSFTGTNGANPYAGPSCDPKGNIYVTTTAGGTKNKGTTVTVRATSGLCKPSG